MTDMIFTISEGDTSYQLYLPDSESDYIQKRLRETGIPYEVDMLRDMAKWLDPRDTVFDIGANVGNHTLYLAAVTGCRVVAFEPNDHLANAISRSVGLNGLSERVAVKTVGVGDVEGMAHFTAEIPENLGGQSIELGQGPIRVITLDSLQHPDPVRMLKIDVEGFELPVLQGARALISRDRPIIYAECVGPEQLEAVSGFLHDLDYILCGQFNATPTHLFMAAEYAKLTDYSRDVVVPKTLDLYKTRADRDGFRKSVFATSAKYRDVTQLLTAQRESAISQKAHFDATLQQSRAELAQQQEKAMMLSRQFEEQILALRQEADAQRQTAEQQLRDGEERLHRAQQIAKALRQEADAQRQAAEQQLRDGEERLHRAQQIAKAHRDERSRQDRETGAALARLEQRAAEQQQKAVQQQQKAEEQQRRAKAVQAELEQKLATTSAKLAARATLRRHLDVALRRRLNGGVEPANPGDGRHLGALGLLWLHQVPPVRGLSKVVIPRTLRQKAGNWLRKKADFLPPPKAQPPQKTQGPKPQPSLNTLLSAADFVVLTGAYPSALDQYGGEFIRTRVEAYLALGLTGCVVELNKRHRHEVREATANLQILRLPLGETEAVVKALSSGKNTILAHSPSPELQGLLGQHITGGRLIYWFHGFELRDYRRLPYNFTTPERESRRALLDRTNQERWQAARQSFSNPDVSVVLVSDYLRDIAIRDVGCLPERLHIIHNYIDGDFYSFVPPSQRGSGRILLLRPFKQRNYAGDIATRAIKLLASRPGFSELSFTVRGFGEYFKPDTDGLQGLPNVLIEEKYSTPEEMKALYASHDIALCPTRHDTQGVSFGEAMASGMACISHDVAAIPQFADADTAVLVRPDDVAAYAEAIWDLAHDPARIARLGTAAAARMRAQCGMEATIHREVALIRSTSEVIK